MDKETKGNRLETNAKYFKFELNKEKDGYIISAKNIHEMPESIVIPKYYKRLPITNIKYNGFCYCTNIKEIDIPNTVRCIDKRYCLSCKIGDEEELKGAFCGCISLQSISFEEESVLQYIGPFSFLCCSNLEEIKIPPNVKYIGEKSFRMCFKLKYVYIDSEEIPVIGKEIFDKTSENLKIYVEGSNLVKYQNDDLWRSYADKIYELY